MATDPKLQAISGGLAREAGLKPESREGDGAARHPAGDIRAERGVRHVFVRDLVLGCNIGVHRHEKDGPQRVRLNLDLAARDDGAALDDDLANVVCYEDIVTGVRAIVGGGHINLVETLAERIAAFCLRDARVLRVRVRVEKLDIVPDAESVGVEVLRERS